MVKVKGTRRAWECQSTPGNVISTEFDVFYAYQGLLDLADACILNTAPRSPRKPGKRAVARFFSKSLRGTGTEGVMGFPLRNLGFTRNL